MLVHNNIPTVLPPGKKPQKLKKWSIIQVYCLFLYLCWYLFTLPQQMQFPNRSFYLAFNLVLYNLYEESVLCKTNGFLNFLILLIIAPITGEILSLTRLRFVQMPPTLFQMPCGTYVSCNIQHQRVPLLSNDTTVQDLTSVEANQSTHSLTLFIIALIWIKYQTLFLSS